ncbi:hypothetical protein HK103_002959 [Boothiomyces macroporosus]|uniref:Uncharacterized protein n=1 Tax=Boothiomyces macroporosus TaxID=261099 RepID=A0AAD5UIF4_9FUNG|nr:hypothetical protein HK103_002959 [Boothiomyces macroporosus]
MSNFGEPVETKVSNEIKNLFRTEKRYKYVEITEVIDLEKMLEKGEVKVVFKVRPTTWRQKCIDLEYVMKLGSFTTSTSSGASPSSSLPTLGISDQNILSPFKRLYADSTDDEMESPKPSREEQYNFETPLQSPRDTVSVADPFDQQAQSFSNSLANPLFRSPTSQFDLEFDDDRIQSSYTSFRNRRVANTVNGYLDDLYSSIRDEEGELNLDNLDNDSIDDSEQDEQSTTYLDNVLDTLEYLQDGNPDNNAILQRLKTNVVEILSRYTSSFNGGNEEDDETASNDSLFLTEL